MSILVLNRVCQLLCVKEQNLTCAVSRGAHIHGHPECAARNPYDNPAFVRAR
jgi:hypothetical protein